ncbi:MAG: ATP-binding protein [Saprospiraceae bacterium]
MINYKTLRFQDKKTEDHFNKFYLANELKVARYALLLGIVTFLLFIPLDYFLFGDTTTNKQFLVLRISISLFLAIGYCLIYRWVNTYQQLQFFASVMVLVCFASTFIYSAFDKVDHFYYFIGNMLIVIIGFNLSNIRFNYLRFIAVFFILIHLYTVNTNFDISIQDFAYQAFGIISISLVSLASSWVIEYQKRKNFLNNQLIEKQKNTLKANNLEKDDLLLKLKERNQELNVFNHSVSHDLKTPLIHISSFAGLLAKNYTKVLDDEGQLYLKYMLESTAKMNELITDLLAYSKVKQTILKRTEIDINYLVTSIFKEQIRVFTKKPILAKVALPPIQADKVLITQVWNNLISNALKYSSKQEEINIKIGFTKATEGITYFIKDNGAGFDMKYVERLFEPFSRLHNEQDFKGTGIGLSLVARIMKKHNGKIWAESEPDKGATFYLFLPN